jgi:hypothetical protein
MRRGEGMEITGGVGSRRGRGEGMEKAGGVIYILLVINFQGAGKAILI